MHLSVLGNMPYYILLACIHLPDLMPDSSWLACAWGQPTPFDSQQQNLQQKRGSIYVVGTSGLIFIVRRQQSRTDNLG